jgi:DNA repair exonuclease SbcCD ATPase subunit
MKNPDAVSTGVRSLAAFDSQFTGADAAAKTLQGLRMPSSKSLETDDPSVKPYLDPLKAAIHSVQQDAENGWMKVQESIQSALARLKDLTGVGEQLEKEADSIVWSIEPLVNSIEMQNDENVLAEAEGTLASCKTGIQFASAQLNAFCDTLDAKISAIGGYRADLRANAAAEIQQAMKLEKQISDVEKGIKNDTKNFGNDLLTGFELDFTFGQVGPYKQYKDLTKGLGSLMKALTSLEDLISWSGASANFTRMLIRMTQSLGSIRIAIEELENQYKDDLEIAKSLVKNETLGKVTAFKAEIKLLATFFKQLGAAAAGDSV